MHNRYYGLLDRNLRIDQHWACENKLHTRLTFGHYDASHDFTVHTYVPNFFPIRWDFRTFSLLIAAHDLASKSS